MMYSLMMNAIKKLINLVSINRVITVDSLFEHSDYERYNFIVIGVFDTIYETLGFIKIIGYLVDRRGFGSDGASCRFPDMNSYEEIDHFEGVEFALYWPERETIISDEEFYFYLRLACERYVKLRPKDAGKIADLLKDVPLGSLKS